MTTTRKNAAAAASPNEVWRLAEQEVTSKQLELEYWWHIVRPLLAKGYPAPHEQMRLIPGRRYAWDFCWPEQQLAVEVQGQVWHKGAHTSGYGVTRDAAKLNELSCIGWRCLFVTAAQIASGEALDWTERALRAAASRAS